MNWGLFILGALLALLLLIAIPFAIIYLRRRFLALKGVVFDADLYVTERDGTRGWAAGICRYLENSLEWYRTFSLRLTPTLVFPRDDFVAVSVPAKESAEMIDGLNWITVIRISSTADDSEPRELAMFDGSATGLLSWFEAAPPKSDQGIIRDLTEGS